VQAVAAGDSVIGLVLSDKYRVVREIGRGGMGVVYEAEHVELGKRVAIKLMLDKYAQDGEATARFHREARAAGRIGNPHIIDVVDTGSHSGRPFVVMELLSGLPLSKVIEMSGAIPPWRAIPIMRQVLRAVGAAHAKGIIHRDLKPDNIFILSQDDHHDFVKLLDFGISKVVDADEQIAFTKLTTTGVVMGTPLYMAPEQAMGQPIERAADLYACGVILFEMLAGRPPFEGQTYAVLVAKLLTQPPPMLSELKPGLPGALVAAVHRALEKEPKDRFVSAEQFLMALPGEKTPSMLELAGTIDSSSGKLAVPAPSTLRGARGKAKARWPLFVVLAAAVVGAGVVTFLALQSDKGANTNTVAAGSASEPSPPPQPAGSAQQTLPQTPSTPAVGQLQIKTVPTGALVSINGQPRGTTPIEITLEPGRYKVKVELAGYDAIESEEDVRAKERASVVLQLQATRSGSVAKKLRGATPEVKKTRTDTQIDPKSATSPQVPASDDVKPETKPEPTVKGTKPNPYGGKGAKPNPY
jgi:serine/threonine-protein kinase